MPNVIIHKLSQTPSKIPDVSEIALGELAINANDGKAFIKQSQSGIESIVEIGASIGEPSQLELITQNTKTGWRLLGRDPINYGSIGEQALDFSYSSIQSTVTGATGDSSFASGINTIAEGRGSFAEGRSTTETVTLRDGVVPPPVATTIQFLYTTNQTTSNPLASERVFIYDNSTASPDFSGPRGNYPPESNALFTGTTDASGNVTIPLLSTIYLIVFPDLQDPSVIPYSPFVVQDYDINVWIEGRRTLANGDRINVYDV